MAHANSDYKIARSVAMPFYIVCDISGSMCESPKAGHAVPVDIIEENLPGIIDAIQDDKLASSIVWLSIIEFGSTARRILDLKSISDPKIQVDGLSRGGATNYEAVFSLLADTLETDIERLRRENSTLRIKRPVIYFITDGNPYYNNQDQPVHEWGVPYRRLFRLPKDAWPWIIALGLGNVDRTTIGYVASSEPRGIGYVPLGAAVQDELVAGLLPIITTSISQTSHSAEIQFPKPPGMRRVTPIPLRL